MTRYKDYSYEQTKLIPVSHNLQILPGTFEYTLSEVIGSIDRSLFDNRYYNDATDASAYDPRILLQIVLFAYSKAVIYSRRIAHLCHDNVIFMVLSVDTRPRFTTIADFISSMQDEITGIFRHVLQICMKLDLIDGSMCALCGRISEGNSIQYEIPIQCIDDPVWVSIEATNILSHEEQGPKTIDQITVGSVDLQTPKL